MSNTLAQDPSSNLPPPPPPLGGGMQQSNNTNTNSQSEQMPSATSFSQQSTPQPTPQPSHQQFSPSSSNRPRSATADISTEEYVEAVIEERWADLEEDIRKIVEWKNRSEQKITQVSQQFEDLKDRFDKLHAALIGKIETYDKNILEVGAEIKAMEQVFSKVLPTFTDNVKQLDEITRKLKK